MLTSPDGLAYARKKIAEFLGEVERNREAQMKEARARRVASRSALRTHERAGVAEAPAEGREALRQLFEDGRIDLEVGHDGVYVGKSALLPLVLFAEKKTRGTPVKGFRVFRLW